MRVGVDVARQLIDNPILNPPYDEPTRHWRFDEQGLIVPEVVDGRRPSETWVPVPPARKGRVQQELPLGHPVERRKRNEQVNQVRARVDLWRRRGYPDVTPTSKRLLTYWSDAERDNRVLFCQREAAETAIFLTEAAPKQGEHWIRSQLDEHNAEYNAGVPRIAVKMATGSGKTVVMAMLIAWQTLNKTANPQDARFSRRFLVVTPGITIRDRLRVLLPADEENYYKARDLVPSDLWAALRRAEIVITNFHSFLLRTTREGKGISANTKLVLNAGRQNDPFTETPDQMVSRVLRELTGSGRRGEIVVLNDEAHHCYLGRPVAASDAATERDLKGDERREAADRNREAGVWFSGLQHVARKAGVKTVYDLSATPFFLKGSGYPEGYLFPWVVCDFSLMDAIESGIVKVPRVPVDDNAPDDDVTYLHLWPHIADELPKGTRRADATAGEPLPATLEGALHSLYGHYRQAFERWERSEATSGQTPPVFIVVCNNTTVSKMVYDYVAGYTVESPSGERHVGGELPLFSNYGDTGSLARPRTILVDSRQLESGEGMTADFKKKAADEIERYHAEYARRTGRGAEELDDTDILREVLNTVGKQGKLGAEVRCVVSVSMLTEGWDANTVTHILGVRAFGSQLLCEQVVGRGLRRRSYTVNESGCFDPEYADVYGVPFSFVRVEPGEAPDREPAPIPVRVQAQEDRWATRIVFPKLDGYRIEQPDERLYVDFAAAEQFPLTLGDLPTRTETGWWVGEVAYHDLDRLRGKRTQEVAYRIARRIMRRFDDGGRDDSEVLDGQGRPKPWLFPQLVAICRQWLEVSVDYAPDTFPGLFALAELEARAAERVNHLLLRQEGLRDHKVLAVLRRFDPEGSTDDVDFFTTKRVYETEPKRCPVNFVVLDGRDGNTWEQIVAQALESLDDVAAYVKNDHLELAVPYVHAGRTHRYLPDFVVRLVRRGDDVERHLLVEVSGTLKPYAMTQEKSDTTRNLWCAAVNNHGGWGRWGFIEITDPPSAKQELRQAIAALYADAPITGLPS